MAQDFLVELGCEELPPTHLSAFMQSLAESMQTQLSEAGLSFTEIKPFATPRRLALLVSQLAEQQPDQTLERRGPSLKAAFDANGQPTKALLGFAQSCQASIDELSRLETDKGAWMVYRSVQSGQATRSLLPAMLQQAFAQLPVPKRMRWGASREEFSRPVHWLVALFGTTPIDCQLFGCPAGRITYGHRFHAPQAIELGQPSDYLPALQAAQVITDFEQRRENIRAQVLEEARKHQGQAVIDESLLDEVTGLVEWPVALTGSFDEAFLAVPDACLISSMKANQKYFHLVDSQGKLLPLFITISNLASQNPGEVIRGNEKVIRPRLADAAFFFETDRKTRLSSRFDGLEKVVFQQQLGTLADKSRRISALASQIAEQLGADVEKVQRAAYLSKCDLSTEMVLEFPELQGIMGEAYARHDGENPEVCHALFEQYLPRHGQDELPHSLTGICLSLADRLDTLSGIFGLGMKPSGVKDPFALRRASLGVLNLLVNRSLDLDLKSLIEAAFAQHQALPEQATAPQVLLDYMLDRFRAWYQGQGIITEVFLSVRQRGITHPLDFDRRVQAVSSFMQKPEARALAAANKRVSNLLNKLPQPLTHTLNPALFTDAAEIRLAEQLAVKKIDVAPLFAHADYTGVMNHLAQLREPVDAFFEQVLVMAEDENLRLNRLALLAELQSLFMDIADISLLPQ